MTFAARRLEQIAVRSKSFTLAVSSLLVRLKYQETRSLIVFVSVALFTQFASGRPIPSECLASFDSYASLLKKSVSMKSRRIFFSIPFCCEGLIGGRGGRLGLLRLEA